MILNQSKEDLVLSEYELLVNELIRVIGFLSMMVENTAQETELIKGIKQSFSEMEGNEEPQILEYNSSNLMDEF